MSHNYNFYQIEYVSVLIIFYLVILIITLGNFKTKKIEH